MTIKHKKKGAERPLETENSEGPNLLGASHIGHHGQHQVITNQQANGLQV